MDDNKLYSGERVRYECIQSFQNGWFTGNIVVLVVTMVTAFVLPNKFIPWVIAITIILSWAIVLAAMEIGQDHFRY